MKQRRIAVLVALAVTLLAANFAAANFTNPGFESPITSDGPPFVGFWEGFSSAGTGSAANSSTTPRTGAMAVNLGLTAGNAFAGVFQDIPNLVPGFPVSFGGWHRTTGTAPINLGVEVRIEWREFGNQFGDFADGQFDASTNGRLLAVHIELACSGRCQHGALPCTPSSRFPRTRSAVVRY